MPLIQGKSNASVSKNIAIERSAGKPTAQAIAIAESEKDKAEKMNKGGMVRCEGCGDEHECNVEEDFDPVRDFLGYDR